MNDDENRLGPARGCMNGILLSVPFWLLLIALILGAYSCPTHARTWSWDGTDNTIGYRIYWTTDYNRFCASSMIDVGPGTPEGSRVKADVQLPDPEPGVVIYVLVTAYNLAGESDTEHGAIASCSFPD